MNGFLLIVAFIILMLIISVFASRCPKCKRFFAKTTIAKKTLSESGWFSPGLRRITHRCIYCRHNWTVKVNFY